MMSKEQIHVFVVDDHPMTRLGLVRMIESTSDLRYVGEAGGGEEALQLVPMAMPHVVLIDLVMPEMDGVDTLVLLRQRLPSTRFVMLTGSADPSEVQRALAVGAMGYVLKREPVQELLTMIRRAASGRRVLSVEVVDALAKAHQQPKPTAELTQRERELLALMARGLNNQEIAAQLAIAMPTVKFHITNILAKLQADNRTDAVLKAFKYRLVPPPG